MDFFCPLLQESSDMTQKIVILQNSLDLFLEPFSFISHLTFRIITLFDMLIKHKHKI